jgi:hypothetical protein
LTKYNGIAAVDENLVRILNSRLLFLPGWNAVKSSVPKDVQFTSVSVANDLTYRISGDAKSISSIASFSKVLEEKIQAESVVPSSVTKKADSNNFSFGIGFELTKTGGTQ